MTAPRITLKLAASLDGRIAARSGAARWITGEKAREEVHRMRAAHDAVLVGAGTMQADDPDLRVRLPGYHGSHPLRVVLDPHLSLRTDSLLAQTAHEAPVMAFALMGADPALAGKLGETGVIIEQVAGTGDYLDLHGVLARLAARGMRSVLVEGGGHTAASFLRAGLVDRLEWFRAPILLGGEGAPAVAALDVDAPDLAPRFALERTRMLGDDVWETYIPMRPAEDH